MKDYEQFDGLGLDQLFNLEHSHILSCFQEVPEVRDIIVATPLSAQQHVPTQENSFAGLLGKLVLSFADVARREVSDPRAERK